MDNFKLSEIKNMKFYNGLIKSVVYGMSRLIRLPEKGNLWPIVDANNLIHWAREASHSQSAVARNFCYNCELPPETFEW